MRFLVNRASKGGFRPYPRQVRRPENLCQRDNQIEKNKMTKHSNCFDAFGRNVTRVDNEISSMSPIEQSQNLVNFLETFLETLLALQNSNPSLNLLEIEAAFFILFQKTVYWPMLSTVYEPILF